MTWSHISYHQSLRRTSIDCCTVMSHVHLSTAQLLHGVRYSVCREDAGKCRVTFRTCTIYHLLFFYTITHTHSVAYLDLPYQLLDNTGHPSNPYINFDKQRSSHVTYQLSFERTFINQVASQPHHSLIRHYFMTSSLV